MTVGEIPSGSRRCRCTRSAPAEARSRRSTRGGALSVGPESAGSEPGPACYGRGGARADGDRLPARPRTAGGGLPAREPARARRRAGPRGDREHVADAARPRRRGGGSRRRSRSPTPRWSARCGSRCASAATIRASSRSCLRRRRPAARRRARAAALDRAGDRAAASRHALGARLARPPTCASTTRRASCTAATTAPPPAAVAAVFAALAGRRAARWTPTARLDAARLSTVRDRATCATPARHTRSACR